MGNTSSQKPVTRAELENWTAAIEEKMNIKYQILLDQKTIELVEAHRQIEELENQLESLRNINSNQRVPNAVVDTDPAVVDLSREKIDAIVEDILNNERMNIKYLPDFVERAIYKNVLNLFINVLDRAVSSVHIKFLGHQLSFDIDPQQSLEDKKTK